MLERLQQDVTCRRLLPYFTDGTDSFGLADACTRALDAHKKGDSEPFAADLINSTLVELLQRLEHFLPVPLRLGIKIERDRGDSVSGMTLVKDRMNPLRPDGVIRHSDNMLLLLKWEEKEAGQMPAAVEDLQKKTAVWPEVYYGPVPYLLAIAQSGEEFQLCVLEKSGRGTCAAPAFVGPRLNLGQLEGKAHLVVAVVQLHRYLKALAKLMPSTVPPLGKAVHSSGQGFSRTIYFEAQAIDKAITPWTTFSNRFGITIKGLESVYAAAQQSPHLVHGTPAVETNTYFVQLSPVGLTPMAAQPVNEKEVAYAVKGGLAGLAALHQADIVHRDVREPNFTCNPNKSCYFWLDLELCGPAGKPKFQCQHWDVHRTLVDGRYTPQSDLYDFGVMVKGWAGCARSPLGQVVVQLLQVPASQQHRSAQDLLFEAQPWFTALGV